MLPAGRSRQGEQEFRRKFRSEYCIDRYSARWLLWSMSYAILRTAKLTSFGNVAGSASHNFRERQTLNADPDRTPSNRTTGAQSAKQVVSAIKARLSTVKTVRKNAVLAVEYFIGASPEWFKEQSTNARENYFDAAQRWLEERHGSSNVIAFTRQYDETSPHVCAYVVPIDEKGKLNCSYFLDGRTKLSEMQTDFAEKVGRPFGLDRGIEGSQAKHQTIKQYYSKIQAPVKPKMPEVQPTTGQKLAQALGIPNDYGRALDLARQKREAELLELEAKAKQYELDKASRKLRDDRLSELRSTAVQVRGLPLDSVLERFGCTQDPQDFKNWRTPVGRLTIDGAKFYAHDHGKGGGGAIDLVMLIEETDYAGAVNRLAHVFGTGAVLSQAVATLKEAIESAAAKAPPPYRAPDPKPETWDKVRKYLVETRRLGARLVDRLHDLGKVYSDRYSNAVFVLGNSVGVELRGTGEKPFHGVRGQKSYFELPDRGENKVAFVESSIDAISLFELGFKGRIISTAGNSSELAKAAAEKCRADGLTVVAAFDNDRAGEQMAANLGHPTERIYPVGKDWNDDLRASRPTAEALRLAQDEKRRDRSPGR